MPARGVSVTFNKPNLLVKLGTIREVRSMASKKKGKGGKGC